tara:strand:- start:95041 stop:96048 length:1008 start_codon:yes stop_codon:yes gene_type:complete
MAITINDLNGFEVAINDSSNGKYPDVVSQACSLKKMTRWQIGGPADLVVKPRSHEQVRDTIRSLASSGVPWLAMGYASNLLIDDGGVRGAVVLLTKNLAFFQSEGVRVRVGGGAWVPGFANRVSRLGLHGAEHIVGIPGTIGGLICMNGGSNRKSIGDNVVEVRCLDRNANEIRLTQSQCCFGRRSSLIQREGWIVTEATLEFKRAAVRKIRREMKDILACRRRKFPLKSPNCGSVFVSDPKNFLKHGPPGEMIERCGLKGLRFGDAQVSPQHANFIVNLGHATSSDVLRLIKAIRDEAVRQFNCHLECEVRYVSSDCQVRPAHLVLADTSSLGR